MIRTTGGLACILVVCLLLLVPSRADKRDRELIGWSIFNEKEKKTGEKRGLEILSWSPRIFIYRGFLSEEECDNIVSKATPRLTRSGVVDTDTGNSATSEIRTSFGMFFDRGEDKVIQEVERRLSEWTMIPVDQGEGIQVLRYGIGQEYKPHHDYFFHEGGIDNGGNRIATVLMYLATPTEGGETVFPNVKRPASQTREAGFTECAMKGMAVRPRKGDAVLFWSLRTDGTLDRGALHGSCPVVSGVKFAATKWYHVARYAAPGEKPVKVKHVIYKAPPPPAPPGCVDKHKSCADWAEGGECENNPLFMVGTKAVPGSCLLSCGRCDLMPTRGTTYS